jgi:hypothetical protein
MPVTLSCFDMDDVADGDIALFGFGRDFTAVMTRIWSQSCTCHPVVAPIRKLTTLQRKFSDCPSPMTACRVRLTSPPVQPAIGVAVSIGFSCSWLILSTRMTLSFLARPELHLSNRERQEAVDILSFGVG